MRFLGNTSLSNSPAGKAVSQLQSLQAKMADADQAREFIRQRKQAISDYISQHAGLAGSLGKPLQELNKSAYYYSRQLRQYKDMLNDPDKLEAEALDALKKLPAFQAFMKQNSQLAGLFSLPANYGTPQGLTGLQTRDQISALINGQIASGGSAGQAALQSNLQAAQSQLDGYKDKLNKLGLGGGDIDMPNFKPNGQKTKTFWRRLEYGANIQTTRDNYAFPTISDIGLSVGYKIDDRNTIGLGVSYKLGWGNGIRHIHFTSEGVGLRSFLDVKIKGTLSATGGFEYNYAKPFATLQQISYLDKWTQSGLIGLTKTISKNNSVFKKTKISLLWDFLSYQQVPRTHPLLFRFGYNF